MRTTSEKIVLSLIAALLLATVVKDWVDFSACGAAGQCLADAGQMQLFTKFSMSFLITVLAFIVAGKAFCARDGRFLRITFISTLLADFSFSMIKVIAPESGDLSSVLGIACFMLCQTVLIYRHSRADENDKSFPKAYWIVAAFVVVFVVLAVAGVLQALVAEVLAYAAFLITSVVVGVLAPRKAYFPKANAPFIRWGMVCFISGDVLVGLSMLSGPDNSAVQLLSSIANNFIWLVYVPTLLLLIRGAAKE